MSILSILIPIVDTLGHIVHYNVTNLFVPYLVFGLFILAVGTGIVFLIIFAVKYLKRLRKKIK